MNVLLLVNKYNFIFLSIAVGMSVPKGVGDALILKVN